MDGVSYICRDSQEKTAWTHGGAYSSHAYMLRSRGSTHLVTLLTLCVTATCWPQPSDCLWVFLSTPLLLGLLKRTGSLQFRSMAPGISELRCKGKSSQCFSLHTIVRVCFILYIGAGRGQVSNALCLSWEWECIRINTYRGEPEWQRQSVCMCACVRGGGSNL